MPQCVHEHSRLQLRCIPRSNPDMQAEVRFSGKRAENADIQISAAVLRLWYEANPTQFTPHSTGAASVARTLALETPHY